MKRIVYLWAVLALVISCKEAAKETEKSEKSKKEYVAFGEKIPADGFLEKTEMAQKYAALQKGDTIVVKFASTVNEVCKKKGCWMKVDLGDGKETMVRFKDYGFFVPKNSDGSEVIVNGKAFITEISVDELRHFAKDAGESEEEIAAITEPKVTYGFEADGVLMPAK